MKLEGPVIAFLRQIVGAEMALVEFEKNQGTIISFDESSFIDTAARYGASCRWKKLMLRFCFDPINHRL